MSKNNLDLYYLYYTLIFIDYRLMSIKYALISIDYRLMSIDYGLLHIISRYNICGIDIIRDILIKRDKIDGV